MLRRPSATLESHLLFEEEHLVVEGVLMNPNLSKRVLLSVFMGGAQSFLGIGLQRGGTHKSAYTFILCMKRELGQVSLFKPFHVELHLSKFPLIYSG